MESDAAASEVEESCWSKKPSPEEPSHCITSPSKHPILTPRTASPEAQSQKYRCHASGSTRDPKPKPNSSTKPDSTARSLPGARGHAAGLGRRS